MSEHAERAYKNGFIPHGMQPTPGSASGPGEDAELFRLCAQFYRGHMRWVKRFEAFADNEVDRPDVVAELTELKSVWKSALDQLSTLGPATLSGALAKFEVASRLLAWAGEGDGSASAFLALADRELRPFLRSSEAEIEQPHWEDGSGQPEPLQCFDRLSR